MIKFDCYHKLRTTIKFFYLARQFSIYRFFNMFLGYDLNILIFFFFFVAVEKCFVLLVKNLIYVRNRIILGTHDIKFC